MVAPLRRVIVRPPGRAFGNADPVRWHYTDRPDLTRAQAEHRALVELLAGCGAEIILHDNELPDLADAIYVHDPVLVTDRGAVLLRMGKSLRRGEEQALGDCLERAGVPLLGRLTGDAMAEAGDCLWLDQETLAVGLGARTNAAGLDQLRSLLAPSVRLLPVTLPPPETPDSCLHLMSFISLVDERLAVVYSPLLPPDFRRELERRRLTLVEVPEVEYPTMGPNVLALAPRQCLMLDGNPRTRQGLEAAGARVLTYVGLEISLKAEGGPTCLTRPVWRAN
jgi:N-dimethylarginine dimethylaminohydrolase